MLRTIFYIDLFLELILSEYFLMIVLMRYLKYYYYF